MITRSIVSWFLTLVATLLSLINPESEVTSGMASAVDVGQAGNWIGIIDPFVPVNSIVSALVAGLAVMGLMISVYLVRMVISAVTGGGGSV